MGITNCAANFMSLLAPLMVGFVLDDAVSSFIFFVFYFFIFISQKAEPDFEKKS